MKLNLMTLAEVCLALRVSRKTAYRMITAGVLPPPKRLQGFRQLYFDGAEIDRILRRGLR